MFTLRDMERYLKVLANSNGQNLLLTDLDSCFFIGHSQLGEYSDFEEETFKQWLIELLPKNQAIQ